MKKIKKTIYGLIALASLFLACGESIIPCHQPIWTGSMLLICYLSARLCEKNMTKEEKEERV